MIAIFSFIIFACYICFLLICDCNYNINHNIMKNINKLPILPILVLLFPLLLSACQNSDPKVGDVITVDVTKSYPKKELILQDLFDIEYIPL